MYCENCNHSGWLKRNYINKKGNYTFHKEACTCNSMGMYLERKVKQLQEGLEKIKGGLSDKGPRVIAEETLKRAK